MTAGKATALTFTMLVRIKLLMKCHYRQQLERYLLIQQSESQMKRYHGHCHPTVRSLLTRSKVTAGRRLSMPGSEIKSHHGVNQKIQLLSDPACQSSEDTVGNLLYIQFSVRGKIRNECCERFEADESQGAKIEKVNSGTIKIGGPRP